MFYTKIQLSHLKYLLRMRKLFLSSLLILLIPITLKAQRRYGQIEKSSVSTGAIFFSIGPEYCFADTKKSPFSQNVLNNKDFSVGFKVKYPNNFGYKALINYTTVTGSDGYTEVRNYSFSTKIWQMSIQGEYTFNLGQLFGHSSSPNSIYLFLGIGMLNSNADLNYSQRIDYDYKTNQDNEIGTSAIIPYGIGYQHDFNNNFVLGVEYNLRYSFSDYLDGFKPPYPDSKSNDVLQGFSLTLSYKLY